RTSPASALLAAWMASHTQSVQRSSRSAGVKAPAGPEDAERTCVSSAGSANSSSMISSQRSTHSSQMYTPGPRMSFLTCFWLFPQNEHLSKSPPSPTRATQQLLHAGAPQRPGHHPGSPTPSAASSTGTSARSRTVPSAGSPAKPQRPGRTTRIDPDASDHALSRQARDKRGTSAGPRAQANVFTQVIGRAAVTTVMICKTVGFVAGALPPNPRPSLGDGGCKWCHLLARAGRALPQNLRGPQGLTLIDPLGRPLPPPENLR